MSNGSSRKRKKNGAGEAAVAAETPSTRVHVKRWTVQDKKNLLKALKKYGHTDIGNICNSMKNKSPSAVKLFIHKVRQKAKMIKSQRRSGNGSSRGGGGGGGGGGDGGGDGGGGGGDGGGNGSDGCTALESWLESGMFSDKSSPIPQALKFLSMFEKHPSPEESNGFDFRAAYDYLCRMMLGHYPAMDVSDETAALLEDLLIETRRQVWPSAEQEVTGYLGTLEGRRRALKRYPAMSQLESRRIIGPD